VCVCVCVYVCVCGVILKSLELSQPSAAPVHAMVQFMCFAFFYST